MATAGFAVLPRRRSRVERERARERRDEQAQRRREKRNARLRRALVVLVFVIACLPVLFVADAASYVPLITVVLFAVFDAAYLALLSRRLEFDAEAGALTCERGSGTGVSVRLRNSSLLVFPRVKIEFFISDLFGGYASRSSVSVTLRPRERREIPLDTRFRHLGRYTFGVSEVVIYDLIGLMSRSIERPLEQAVTVTPRIFDPASVMLSNESVVESATAFSPIVTDDMDYAGVREYRFGDPLKTVHWKLSSRYPGSEMFTRLFEVYGNPGLETIIDAVAPGFDDEDLMHVFDGLVEAALSVNLYARDAGMDAEIAYIARDGEPRTMQVADVSRADSLVEGMRRVERESEAPEPDASIRLLAREGASPRGKGNVAFCTSRLDEQAFSALMDIRNRRRHPLLLLVVPRSLEGDERSAFLAPLRRLDAAQVPYYIVESTEFATEVVGS